MSKMIGGAHGRILHIDLSTGETRVERLDRDFYRLLVGGRAAMTYLLLRDLQPGTDPLSPDNFLVFAPGLLQGTGLPGAGRHGVGAKSPLTNALGSSEVGGWWGHEFKWTGYDALVIRGRANSPVYLWIRDDDVAILPADHLWGRQTAPVQAAIRREHADDRVRVAQIGPAGENLVRYAAIMHDVNRAAGRNGLGAVMGAKNLKAVAVRGTQRPPMADRSRLTAVARWLGQNYKERMSWLVEGVGRGTQDLLMNLSVIGGLPTRNFGKPTFDHPELLSGERNYEMFLKERDTCHGCPVRCKQVFENQDDDPNRSLDPVYGGAEYEAMAAFGSCCDVTDNLAVLKANELANAYGLDVISCGMAIAFAMECFEHGILTTSDTGGIQFRWGDASLLVQAVQMIANREGFGNILAEGVARMADRFGSRSQTFNMTVKGQELPMHEPRLKAGLGAGYTLAPIGADHMVNIHDTSFMNDGPALQRVNTALERPVGPVPHSALNEDKLTIFYHELNYKHFADCALVCHFYAYDYGHMAEALSGVTGIEYSIRDILAVGARAQTLARLFNQREGFTQKDDRLPVRVTQAFDRGPIAGTGLDAEELSWFIREFYTRMKWDPETGEPTTECLKELGIDTLLQT